MVPHYPPAIQLVRPQSDWERRTYVILRILDVEGADLQSLTLLRQSTTNNCLGLEMGRLGYGITKRIIERLHSPWL